jgi:hypothetical protein
MMTFVLPILCISRVISFSSCSVLQPDRERDEPTTPGLPGRSELRGCIPLHRLTGCRISASRVGFGGRLTYTSGAFPIWKSLAASAARYGMIPLRTTIASAEESISSRTSHRPAPRPAITTARVRSRQTDKYMNQRAFFAAFGLTISSSFKASLGTRHRRPNCTQKLNQLRGRRRFSLVVGAIRVGTWRRSSAPPTRFPFCYFSTSYALQQDRLRRSDC